VSSGLKVGIACLVVCLAAGIPTVFVLRSFWHVSAQIAEGEERTYGYLSQLSLHDVELRRSGDTFTLRGVVHNAGPLPASDVRVWYEILGPRGVSVGNGSMIVIGGGIAAKSQRAFHLVIGGAPAADRVRCAIQGGSHSDEWHPVGGI
jgi:hypothetical protein